MTNRSVKAACAVSVLSAALSVAAPAWAQDPCDADLNADDLVSGSDLAIVLGSWGGCSGCAADINGDSLVNGGDLSLVLGAWGTNCAPLPWATVLEDAPNPAVVTNATLRNAIIATGYPWRVRDNGTNIEMVLIPPGTFNMGCSASNAFACNNTESPVHAVTLTNAFYIGRYEVTQAQWTAKMGSNPSEFQSASAEVSAAQVPNRPVEQVAWTTVQNFLTATGLRLPTEAEWEYAYRAGTTTAFHGFTGFLSGTNADPLVTNIGWIELNSGYQTRPVGGKSRNGFGLYDMSGNVTEWVNDWFSVTYYSSSPSTNPPGPASGTTRVIRGGSFDFDASFARSSARGGFAPTLPLRIVGFRVVRNPL